MSQNYSASFVVPQSPQAAFAAVLDVRGWWSGNIDGPTDELGADFSYRYQDIHYTKQQIIDLVPDGSVVWQVLEADLNFTEDRDEWVGTQIRFEVVPVPDGTEVRFNHVGLSPEMECYDKCSNAWGFYINSSLRNLITCGAGAPNPAE